MRAGLYVRALLQSEGGRNGASNLGLAATLCSTLCDVCRRTVMDWTMAPVNTSVGGRDRRQAARPQVLVCDIVTAWLRRIYVDR